MEEKLLALLVANWSALQVCLSIKGKIEEIQYMLFGLRNDFKIPAGEVRQIILGAHLKGYNIALFLVLLLTGCILIAMVGYANLEESRPIFMFVGTVYLIAAVVTAIYQFFDYQNVKSILNQIDRR
ncbi:MAG: hypothetical protein LUQ26_08460 [Methylococcaceae bacterium]|nr:hypothetical protein [Methylococcaceae bacterium]